MKQKENTVVKCPNCGESAGKVLYMGLPMMLCSGQKCSTVFGGCAFMMGVLPFNGWFFHYTGSYLQALWAWFKDTGPGDTQ